MTDDKVNDISIVFVIFYIKIQEELVQFVPLLKLIEQVMFDAVASELVDN